MKRTKTGTFVFFFSTALLSACAPPPEPGRESSFETGSTERAGKVESADGLSISYRVRGEGKPALLFVHGWTGHQDYWKPQVTHFARSHTVVTLDLGGHGESGRDRVSWTVPAFGHDVAAVVNELELDEVVLVGHSFGGPVIVAAAPLLGEKAVGLVGVDTLQRIGHPYTPELIDDFISQFRPDFDTGYKAFLRSLFPADADLTAIESATAGLPAARPEDALAMLRPYFEWQNDGLLKTLQDIEAPIRCINSDRNPTDVRQARKYTPSFDVILMPGASHFPMLDDPATFNRILTDVIRDFEERGGRCP